MPKETKKTTNKAKPSTVYERPKVKTKEEEDVEEEDEVEEKADKSKEGEAPISTRKEGWLYVWRLNWQVSDCEGVPLCILAVGKVGGKAITKEGRWEALLERLYQECNGYQHISEAVKVASPAIPCQSKTKPTKTEGSLTPRSPRSPRTPLSFKSALQAQEEALVKKKQSRVERITPEYVHEHLDRYEDLALLLPREADSKTGLAGGELVLRSVLGLPFPADVVYDMAKQLGVDVDEKKIKGKLKATELVIAPRSTFERLRELFSKEKEKLRMSHIMALMAQAGPYAFHSDVAVEVRPGPKCDPAIHTTIALLLPANASTGTATTMATTTTTTTTSTPTSTQHAVASSGASLVDLETKEAVTFVVDENGVVVIPE